MFKLLGIARFQAVVDHYRFFPKYSAGPQLLTLFSGDAFNPSLESTVTKGEHMVSVLNSVGTDVACIGVSICCHATEKSHFTYALKES